MYSFQIFSENPFLVPARPLTDKMMDFLFIQSICWLLQRRLKYDCIKNHFESIAHTFSKHCSFWIACQFGPGSASSSKVVSRSGSEPSSSKYSPSENGHLMFYYK